jgi:hypothetical protein
MSPAFKLFSKSGECEEQRKRIFVRDFFQTSGAKNWEPEGSQVIAEFSHS